MTYTQDITNAFSNAIGAEGADKKDFDQAVQETKKAVAALHDYKRQNALPLLNIGEQEDDFKIIEDTAKRITDHFETLIVLGMGGSSRGGSTLVSLARNPFTGLAGKTKIHFVENIDPFTFDQLLVSLNLKTTAFLFISKSGNTAETLAQLLVLLRETETKLGRNAIKEHFFIITEPGENPMRRIGQEYGISMIEHNPRIGGRFAALTAVGLLPAKVAGLDIRAIRRSAGKVVQRTFSENASEAALGGALHHVLLRKGKSVVVIMPYCDRLETLGAWHQQLWEESLGKKGHGTTLLRALGATDQHSQLQLYLDGPNDKFITMIFLKQAGFGAAIPTSKEKALSYLNNHTVGDLMEAEQMATAQTLAKNHRPVRILTLDKLNEESIGALLMHFMLETMITAQLWQIDAFDQPAVEEGKQLARQYLSKTANAA